MMRQERGAGCQQNKARRRYEETRSHRPYLLDRGAPNRGCPAATGRAALAEIVIQTGDRPARRIGGVALGEQVVVRAERPDDGTAIGVVNQAAFGGEDEARLVEALRTEDLALISLVAEVGDRIVGHVLFSRMAIETAAGTVPAVALAPVAVLPGYQRQGVGGRLIRRGLDLLHDRGERIVIVVGHAAYYPRFGFSADQARALESPFARDVFMALELSPGALEGVIGRVRYPAAFGI